MKKDITLFLFLILALSTIKSQVVFETPYMGDADTIVYITEYAGLVDLCVYETNFLGEAQSTNGIWYWTQFAGQADFKVYITPYQGLADLTICYTDFIGLAGNNQSCSCNSSPNYTSIISPSNLKSTFSIELGKLEIYNINFTHTEIHDLNGKKVMSFNTKSTNIMHLQPGIYIISIRNEENVKQSKIIIN